MSFTNFANGVASFGVPVMGGLVPATFGDVYFVDYNAGSDDNTGTSMETAVKTLSKAYDLCTTNNNDIVLINGYSQVVETAMITWEKNRCHVIGLNGPFSPMGYGSGARVSLGVTTAATDTATLRVTGVRNTFSGIKFENSNTLATCLHCVEDGGEYTRWFNCEFYKSTLLTTNLTAEVLCNGDSSQWINCTFGDLVNQRGASGVERPNVKLDRETITGKVCRDCAFIDCLFLQKAAHIDARFAYGHNATDVERRLLFIRPIFINAKLAAATPAQSIALGAAQTEGYVLVIDPASVGSATAISTTTGVYVNGYTPDATGAAAGIAIQAA